MSARRRTRRSALLAASAALALAPLTALAVTSPGQAATPAAAASAADPSPGPAATLWAPKKLVAELYGDRERTGVRLDARLVAGNAPLELWSTRASYSEQIRTVWRSPSGDVELPRGSMSTFNALGRFVRVQVTNVATGKKSKSATRSVCLNGYGERVRPDAPARSPYPRYCFANPYSLGSVQGVQAGWSTSVLGRGLRLGRGVYDVTVRITRPYASVFGISADDASTTTRVRVKRAHDHDDHDHGYSGGGGGLRGHTGTARPAAAEPTGPELEEPTGPRPNLRSLPAWGIVDGPQRRLPALRRHGLERRRQPARRRRFPSRETRT